MPVSVSMRMYSHILDDERRKNAALFEDALYARKGIDEEPVSEPSAPEPKKDGGLDMETPSFSAPDEV